MDGMTLHLLTRLDAIRETQLLHGQMLERFAESLAALKTSSSAPKTSPASWPKVAAGAGQWAGAVLALAYLWNGGNVETALAFLQKAF